MTVTAPAAPTGTGTPAKARGPAGVVALFALTTLTGSALLAMAEPMVAKMLPYAYAGSPMAWTASVLFFQIASVAGCGYAYLSERLPVARVRSLLRVLPVLAPLPLLPITLPGWSGRVGTLPPVPWLLLVLAVAAGAPFALLSSAMPLIQRWYASLDPPRSGGLPFVLAGLGGTAALLAYPFLVEPYADTRTQASWWAAGYGVFAALMVGCGLVASFRLGDPERRSAARTDEPYADPRKRARAAGVFAVKRAGHSARGRAGKTDRGPAMARWGEWSQRARWLGLAFVPSSLMLSVTTRISSGFASVPTVWVLPLALYLATFAVAFGPMTRRWLGRTAAVAAISAAVLPWAIYLLGDRVLTDGILLAALVLAGLACHGRLAADRPEPRRSGEFFLLMSLGAALGGAFNALVVPAIFSWEIELPIVLTALAVLPLAGRPDADPDGAAAKAFVLAGPLLAVATYLNLGRGWLLAIVLLGSLPWCTLAPRRPRMLAIGAALTTAAFVWYQVPADSYYRQRTFFGDYQVYGDSGWQVLSSGSVIRGYQFPAGNDRHVPVGYYGRYGPLGDLFAGYGNGRVGVVGAGNGTVAAYGHRGQRMDFFERDPALLDIALRRFTYLMDSQAGLSGTIGDGRQRLAETRDGTYGMIVFDGLGFGAVPTHLLTREALRTYVRKLAPGGVLAFHVTHRDLDLARALAATARAAGLAALTGHGAADQRRIFQASTWVAVARRPADLRRLRGAGWRASAVTGPVWTDRRAALGGLLRLG
jgi:SAM-dependent methyltransferase